MISNGFMSGNVHSNGNGNGTAVLSPAAGTEGMKAPLLLTMVAAPVESAPVQTPIVHPPVVIEGNAAPPDEAPKKVNVFEKGVGLVLRQSRLGNSRKLRQDQYEVARKPITVTGVDGAPDRVVQPDEPDYEELAKSVDKNMTRAQKSLLDAKEAQAIERFDGAVRRRIESWCLPNPMGNACYVVPFTKVQAVKAYLQEKFAERQQLVVNLQNVWTDRLQEAEKRLGPLYDAADYPTKEALATIYGMTWNFINFGVSDSLKAIDEALFDQEQQKAEVMMMSAVEEWKIMLRQQMLDIVDHVQDRLSPKSDGSKKVFRSTLIPNVREFLEAFKDKNTMIGDMELEAVVERAQNLLNGVSTQALRDGAMTRQKVQQGFAQMKLEIDKMVTDAPKRKIFHEDV